MYIERMSCEERERRERERETGVEERLYEDTGKAPIKKIFTY